MLAVGLGLIATVFLLPWLGGVDRVVTLWVEAERGCADVALTEWLADVVVPVGVVVVIAATAWRVRHDGWGGIRDLLEPVIAVAIGVAGVDAAKAVIDRPRPGTEFLSHLGNSLPSGHVGNVALVSLAVVWLWGGRGRRPSRVALGAAVMIVSVMAAIRVWGGRHWPSDVIVTGAVMMGYGLLALHHPLAGVRRTTIAGTALLLIAGCVARGAGWRVHLPSAAAPGASLARLRFGDAWHDGGLGSEWRLDAQDAQRSSTWLHAREGRLPWPVEFPAAATLRVVVRPHPVGKTSKCRRLTATVGGHVVGSRTMLMGWRAYGFPLASAGGMSTAAFVVDDAGADRRPADAPRAVFSEVSLHATVQPTDPAPPSRGDPPPR